MRSMNLKTTMCLLAATAAAIAVALPAAAQEPKSSRLARHRDGEDPFGDFEFKNGYPAANGRRLLDQLKFNRAIEVYLTQLMPVAIIESRGRAGIRSDKPNQVVIWENLMDAETIVLTANTETVYALGHLDLKTDGPTVVEAPPKMLGFLQDALQRYISWTSARSGRTRARAESTCSSRRATRARCRRDTSWRKSPTYSVTSAARLQGGRQDRSGRGADEADQGLSAGQGVVTRRRWSS